jgi:hypothetical protein
MPQPTNEPRKQAGASRIHYAVARHALLSDSANFAHAQVGIDQWTFVGRVRLSECHDKRKRIEKEVLFLASRRSVKRPI